MTLDWFYKLGDWNPQFFREFKGRLKPRNLAITFSTSLLIQLVVLSYFWYALPNTDGYSHSNPYCTGEVEYSDYLCINDSLGNVIVNWQRWWGDLFQLLSWVLPFIVLIAGVYMLISDLGKEERRGTFNFIRLSPQSSQSILLGKVLGVPVVPYVAVLLAIPLHLVAAIGAGIPADMVLSIYLLMGAAASCYFTGALLFAFLGGFQGWIGAVIVWFSFTLFFQFWQLSRFPNFLPFVPSKYFGLPVSSHLGLAMAFALITFGTATYWLWQAANRRFRKPDSTLLSKQQSYLVTACFEVWLLGFLIRDRMYFTPLNDFAWVAFVNLVWFVILMAALMPQRQMLLDWVRYRRERVSTGKKFWSRSILKDLIWGEKSPALLAIGLNLLIAAAIFTPWIVTWADSTQQLQALAAIVLASLFVLICAAIGQLFMFAKSPKRIVWASGTIAALIFVPPTILFALSLYPSQVPAAWLFSAFALTALGNTSITMVFTSCLTHLGILTLLTTRLSRQLRKAGESETKALLKGVE
jgi:hypothetical protein